MYGLSTLRVDINIEWLMMTIQVWCFLSNQLSASLLVSSSEYYSMFPVYWTVLSQMQDVNQTRYWKAMFNITSFCLHSKRLLQIDRNFYAVKIVKDHESLFILRLFKCDSALLTFMFSTDAPKNHSLILDPLIIIKHFINEI